MCFLNILQAGDLIHLLLESAAHNADPDHVSGLMPDVEDVKKEEPRDTDNEVSEILFI